MGREIDPGTPFSGSWSFGAVGSLADRFQPKHHLDFGGSSRRVGSGVLEPDFSLSPMSEEVAAGD